MTPSRRLTCARCRSLAMAAFALLAAAPARAGGPIAVNGDGQPFRWDASRPVRYVLDAGAFGSRSHTWAVETVAKAFRDWQASPGAKLPIEAAPDLPRDITGRNIAEFLEELDEGDASPVLLDSDGSIFDELFGDGAADVILGIGGPQIMDSATGRVQVSLAILNGRMHRDFTDAFAEGSFAHELGHFLNLAHSQVNADTLYDGDPDNDHAAPVMFYRGPNSGGGLHADDQAWFAWLYPGGEPAGRGAIRGRVLLPDRTAGLRGVQVIARRVGDPKATAVGSVSGFLSRVGEEGSPDPERLGEFILPNLPAGSYTVELQPLEGFPGVPVPRGTLFSGSKFWREGSSAQDPPTESTPIVVGAGQEVAGIDIVVNGESLGELKPVAEQEPNALPTGQAVSLPTIITGAVQDRIEEAEGTGDGHDVYRVTLRDYTTVTAVLSAEQRSADLDLAVLYLDNQSFFGFAESTSSGTPPETLQLRLPPGRFYFRVHRNGARGSAYTLRLMATPSPSIEAEEESVWLNYLIVGDVTTTGATLRWQATGETRAVVYYNRPIREIGSTTPAREHTLQLPGLAANTDIDAEVYAPSAGGIDATFLPFKTASPAAADGVARIVVSRDGYFLDYDLAEVEVRLSNRADGNAMNVRITELVPASGWEVLSRLYTATRLPDVLEVGGIGAGGSGTVLLRLIRLRGDREPDVSVHGTYSDGSGRERRF